MDRWKNIKKDAKGLLRCLRKSRVKTWYIAIVLVLAVAGSAWGLRANNLKMIQLRNQVLQADSSGRDLQGSLTKLSTFVFKHMNTTVNDLELVNSYNRDVSSLVAQTKAQKNDQAGIYHQAQLSCEHAGEMITTIAQCAQNYVLTHLPKNTNSKVQFPDKTLYSYSFAAPVWSFDLAGISLIVAILSGAWLAERGLTWVVASLIVRGRFHS